MAFTNSAAAVLTSYREPVEVWNIEVPDPEPRAVIVAVEAATMCGTDAHIHAGDFEGGASRIPAVLGHEVVGRIVALGTEGRRDALGRVLRVGDRVAWSYAWCGECYWCAVAKQPTLCAAARQYGWGPADEFPYLTGGFAEFAYIMPQCRMVLVPESLTSEMAASMTCAFRTIVHGFERAGGVTPAETVVVQGSGAVGLYAVAYAIGSGARQVIVIGAPAARLDIARDWGASEVIDIDATDGAERRARILELTDGRGADLVVECAGNRFALQEGFSLVRRGGRYLVIGQSDPTPASIHGTEFNLNQITVTGSVSADISHYYRALQFAADHQDRFPFAAILGSEFSLDTVTDAIDAIAAGRETRPIIRPVRSLTH